MPTSCGRPHCRVLVVALVGSAGSGTYALVRYYSLLSLVCRSAPYFDNLTCPLPDDPGKLLALSNAVAVAGHHEAHLMQGMPAVPGVDIELDTESHQPPLVWSASVHAGSMWLAVTPSRDQKWVKFRVALRDDRADSNGAGSTTACIVTAAEQCEQKVVALHDEAGRTATTSTAMWEAYEVPVNATRADGSTMVFFITTGH
jgi:hypothetical protein